MPQLINGARVDALFDGTPMYDTSSVTVDLPSIQITKTADTDVWIGDYLTYTILISNIEEVGGIVATEVMFVDTIDPAIATLVAGSLTVDGTTLSPSDYAYSPITGVLAMELTDLPAGESTQITFRVQKT